MLAGMANMRMRDGGYDIDEFCAMEGISRTDLESTLAAAGYRYLPALRQFR